MIKKINRNELTLFPCPGGGFDMQWAKSDGLLVDSLFIPDTVLWKLGYARFEKIARRKRISEKQKRGKNA